MPSVVDEHLDLLSEYKGCTVPKLVDPSFVEVRAFAEMASLCFSQSNCALSRPVLYHRLAISSVAALCPIGSSMYNKQRLTWGQKIGSERGL